MSRMEPKVADPIGSLKGMALRKVRDRIIATETHLSQWLDQRKDGLLRRLCGCQWFKTRVVLPSIVGWGIVRSLPKRVLRFPYLRFKRMEAESCLAQYLAQRRGGVLSVLCESRWLRMHIIVPVATVGKLITSPFKKRSVVFLHQNYYHFYYLAKALRARGWDAVLVSLESANSPHANFYHGDDINLFSDDHVEFRRSIREFFAHAKKRFRLLHFSGAGQMSFFPENWKWETDDSWDIVDWKTSGRRVAYTTTGCNDGVAQSSVMKWSSTGEAGNVCQKCPWQPDPAICNDSKNLGWGRKIERNCDAFFTEGYPALDYQMGAKTVREPTTMCLDSAFWRPDLPVPNEFKIIRQPGELLVYHGVGNYEARTQNGRNIKGTPAVIEAIERLKADGIPVRLVFVTGIKSTEVRFIQVQCDVIVDQLNYGRFGSTAQEGMMLGKPTVCYINPNEPSQDDVLAYMRELPLISATEQTIYQVLKKLLLMDPEERSSISRASRLYALKWHSAEACAARYEQIYDQLMRGEKVQYPQSW